MAGLVGLTPFEPIGSVVPFTYRDQATHLGILRGLKDKVNDLIEYINNGFDAATSDLNGAVANLVDQFNEAIDVLEAADTSNVASLNATITAQVNTINSAIAAANQRITDAWATSNTGLDARVTTAEGKVATYMAQVNAGPGRNAPQLLPTEMLAAMADTQNGSVTITVAADSTANDTTDWVRIWMKMYEPLLTDARLRAVYNAWNASTLAWNAPIVDQAGVAIPASGGTILSDSFTRTGEIVGSVPNTGPAWDGKLGGWSADGNYAKQVAAATTAIAIRCVNGYGNPIKNAAISAYINMVTTATGANQQYRLTVGSPGLSSDKSGPVGGVYAFLNISSTGAVTGGLSSLINGVNTAIGTFPAIPGVLGASATAQNITLTVTLNADRTCIATVQKDGQSSVSASGSISESDYAWLGGHAAVGSASLATPGLMVDSVNISSPSIPAPPQPGLTIWNGAAAGATLLYQKSRLSTMFSVKPDILLISMGHNYADLSAAEFVAIVDDFITACFTQWGGTNPKVLIASQNPEGVNTAQPNADFHAARQAALRAYAYSKGYQYLPAYELFKTLPTSAFLSDGIHPSTPAAYPVAAGDTTVYGSVEWAKLMQNFVTSRMYKPVS